MIGRVFRIVRTPLTLLALMAILCYGAWWGWQNVIKEAPPAEPPACVKQKVPKGVLKSSQITVNIYNGGTKVGLAGDVASKLRGREFKIGRVANTKESVSKTVIVGATAKNPEVLLVKSFFGDATIKADNRKDGTVDVLVGNKYGGFNAKAKTSIAVKTEEVCLPAGASPTPKAGG